MSNGHEEDLKPRPLLYRARSLLKLQGNPFGVLCQPQRTDDNFSALHIEELHRKQRNVLLTMVDTYRLQEYREFDQLKPTRAVTVMGDSGSGKTHLLQSVVNRSDCKAQLIVRPKVLESGVSFDEYLLAQMRIALAEQDAFHMECPIDVIAHSISRRLLLQALRGLGGIDRLFVMNRGAPAGIGMLWGGGETYLSRCQALQEQLEDPSSARKLRALIDTHGLKPALAVRIIEAYLLRMKDSTDPRLILRRKLYSAMVQTVLLKDSRILSHFLRSGFTTTASYGMCSKEELVTPLLQALLEACALVKMPVVFAFDNFERLFYPQSTFNGQLAPSFFRNLAQTVESTRGLLFLLFVESGLFQSQILAHIDDYSRMRLEEGVPIPEQGNVHLLRLSPPTLAEVSELVTTRVRAFLRDLPDVAELPSCFPFSEEFIADLAGSGVNLRKILYRLREEYNQVVSKEPDPVALHTSDSSLVWSGHFDTAWKRANAQCNNNADIITHHELHESLGAFLGSLHRITQGEWVLDNVYPAIAIGRNSSYGVVTRIDWKRAPGSTIEGLPSRKVGVGFLLAVGTGMKVDLKAKFDFYLEHNRGARLIILWPTAEKTNLVEALPPGTRQVWEDQSQYHWRTEIRRIEETDLRRILCVRHLLRILTEITTDTPPADQLAGFLQSRLGGVLPLLLPPGDHTSE